ncbi:MAG: alginate export family protein [Chlorobi bacterium]|nr:alginate export family protein [Chlorobiota bacterium]
MKYLLFVIVLLISINIHAQFMVTGQLRPRYEFRNGYKQLPADTSVYAMLVSQRSRIGFHYETEKFITEISFQDVRIWGEEQIKTTTSHITAHELWVQFNMSKSFKLKVGRQSFRYDNLRLISNSNFNQGGAKHDAILLRYIKPNFNIDFVTAFNQNANKLFGTDYSGISFNYKTLNLIWLNYKYNSYKFSLFTIADGFQNPNKQNSVYMRYTPGVIANYKSEIIDATFRLFLQNGKTSTGQKISAFYLNPEFNYKISSLLTLKTGLELMSGNKNNTASYNSFDILYGTKHRFNGKIDYFSTPKTTAYAGLVNPYFKFNYKVSPKLSANTDYHYFRLQEKYMVNNVEADKYLGSEIDLWANYRINKETTISILYAMFFGSKTTELIKGGNHENMGNYFSIVLTFKPVFFKSE